MRAGSASDLTPDRDDAHTVFAPPGLLARGRGGLASSGPATRDRPRVREPVRAGRVVRASGPLQKSAANF